MADCGFVPVKVVRSVSSSAWTELQTSLAAVPGSCSSGNVGLWNTALGTAALGAGYSPDTTKVIPPH